MNLRVHLCLLAALMSAIVLVGPTSCGQGSNNSGSDGGDKKQGGTLTIFAASSLIDAAVALSVLVLGFAFAVILAVRCLTARSAIHRA